MNHAITHLEITASIAENNAPISDQLGEHEQADLQREVASDCRDAIEQLQDTDQGR